MGRGSDCCPALLVTLLEVKPYVEMRESSFGLCWDRQADSIDDDHVGAPGWRWESPLGGDAIPSGHDLPAAVYDVREKDRGQTPFVCGELPLGSPIELDRPDLTGDWLRRLPPDQFPRLKDALNTLGLGGKRW
jgi:hypothetical protein